MPTQQEVDAAVEAIYDIECKRVGQKSDHEDATLKYWQRRVVVALEAAERVRAKNET